MTSQRRLILETLNCLNCHPTAEEVFEIVIQRDPNINLSTVYRTLRWLEQEGLVSTRRFDEDLRCERFDPALPSQHHHFMCKVCGSVLEFDDPMIEALQAQFQARSGATIESASVTFYGVCAQCAGEPVTP